jgi:alpha-1,6-mannosyltransferase
MPAVPRTTWAAALLGLAGSLLVALFAPAAVADPVVRWWYEPALTGHQGALDLLYLGMLLLAGAWLSLGRALPSPRALVLIAGLWALPLILAPPLFSRDIYSYLAQGTIMHLGHSPYTSPPRLLASLGHRHLLDAVSPFWRGTTAPYGPLFLGIVSLIVGAVGEHLVAGVVLVRLLELVGVVMLALAIPQLARALGADPRRALWLTVLSPLTMLELIAAGHNDLLMAGLLAAGLAFAAAGRPLVGIAICAVAATVKVPALAGALFIAVAWARAETAANARRQFVAAALGIIVVALGAVTLITGSGIAWISTSLFATPARVRLAITPATAVGDTVGQVLRGLGVTTTGRGIEAALGLVGSGATAVLGLVLLARVRVPRAVASLGLFLIVAAAAGPAAWPWYFIWGLVAVAVLPGPQRSRLIPWVIALSVFLVKPSGILALPLGSSPVVLCVLIGVGALWWRTRQQRRAVTEEEEASLAGHAGHGGRPSALARIQP